MSEHMSEDGCWEDALIRKGDDKCLIGTGPLCFSLRFAAWVNGRAFGQHIGVVPRASISSRYRYVMKIKECVLSIGVCVCIILFFHRLKRPFTSKKYLIGVHDAYQFAIVMWMPEWHSAAPSPTLSIFYVESARVIEWQVETRETCKTWPLRLICSYLR